jgi:hypothetical protein
MVGSIKHCLQKVLRRSQLDAEGLCKVLTNIEAALNSRPIIQDDEETLTHPHFFNGGS